MGCGSSSEFSVVKKIEKNNIDLKDRGRGSLLIKKTAIPRAERVKSQQDRRDVVLMPTISYFILKSKKEALVEDVNLENPSDKFEKVPQTTKNTSLILSDNENIRKSQEYISETGKVRVGNKLNMPQNNRRNSVLKEEFDKDKLKEIQNHQQSMKAVWIPLPSMKNSYEVSSVKRRFSTDFRLGCNLKTPKEFTPFTSKNCNEALLRVSQTPNARTNHESDVFRHGELLAHRSFSKTADNEIQKFTPSNHSDLMDKNIAKHFKNLRSTIKSKGCNIQSGL